MDKNLNNDLQLKNIKLSFYFKEQKLTRRSFAQKMFFMNGTLEMFIR